MMAVVSAILLAVNPVGPQKASEALADRLNASRSCRPPSGEDDAEFCDFEAEGLRFRIVRYEGRSEDNWFWLKSVAAGAWEVKFEFSGKKHRCVMIQEGGHFETSGIVFVSPRDATAHVSWDVPACRNPGGR